VLVIVSGINLPLADNKNLAKSSFQVILTFYAMAVATAVFVRSAKHAMPILWMLFLQFAWYALFAKTQGRVFWHPTHANYDAFGVLMVQGVGLCFWFAFAAQSKKLRLLLFGLAAYCVLGIVASFARAAFLCFIVVLGWIWIRSPRKVVTGLGIAGAALLVVVAASVIFEPGFFYNEIMSAFQEGTEEGTGNQRWELWKVGFKVWMQRPVFGVGGGNFGAFAANHFRFGELEAFPNPGMLYGFNLHNGYMQVLSEAGAVGLIAFLWAFWDFYQKNRALHDVDARRRWAAKTGGKWDLRYLALGLEAATLANGLGALFYASLFQHALYTTWIANRMLWALSQDPSVTGVGHTPAPTVRRRVARATVIPTPATQTPSAQAPPITPGLPSPGG
jgi:O-antigen ligase